MLLQMKLIPGKDILRLQESGNLDFNHAQKMIKEICSLENLPKEYVILLDARNAHARLSSTEIWYIAAELDKHRRAFQRWNAILVSPDEFDAAEFFETCALNRGLMVRAFTDFERAINWLLGIAEA